MKIAIIGAGFTGLAAAIKLAAQGYQVTVFESSSLPGGLAAGFKEDHWNWPLEYHYHHFFETDKFALDLGKIVGCPIHSYTVNTYTFYQNGFHRLDSPLSLLQFPNLDIISKLRTGLTLAIFRLWPYWKIFEPYTSFRLLSRFMGQSAFDVLWKPLFVKKFHHFWDSVGAVWFWARIRFRTPKLAYPDGGFLNLAQKTVDYLKKQKVKFYFSTPVERIDIKSSLFTLQTLKTFHRFDAVISTLPAGLTPKIAPFYRTSGHIDSLGAVNLVLELNHKFLPQNIYWLNINDYNLPFLAVVEHTNMINTKNYNNSTIVYVGNYLPTNHRYFRLSPKQLLSEYLSGLKLINPDFKLSWIKSSRIFKATYAQSIPTVNFSSQVPPIITDQKDFYLANIEQVYPNDRGVNYAIKIGYQVADYVQKNS